MSGNLQIILSIIFVFVLIFGMGWAACFIWHTEVIPLMLFAKKKKHLKQRR